MAEATDRPDAPGQVSPDAIMSGEELGAAAPGAAETYQPLSLLALAGFGIAVVYSVVVLIGATVALFGRIPWLMPYWTFLIPLGALVICWAARTRIRNSESTLSGLGFTTWGSRLAIVVGLTYAAYYAFTFFAVRLQAVDFADRFFQDLKQGQLEQAFLMAQGVSTKGMEKKELRNTVETRFNQPRGRPGAVGPFTRFRQDHFVRFIEMDGDKANITPRGVDEWEYSKRSYHVVLNYHVATSLVEYDVKVDLSGRDPNPGEPKGRQWQVNFNNGVVAINPESQQAKPLGEEFKRMALTAQNFASEWVGKINQPQWKEAYLDTLKPSERERFRREKKAAQLQPSVELGKLIRIDDTMFWAGKQQREDIKQRVRDTFQLGASGHPTFSMNLQQSAPFVRESDSGTKASFDVSLFYLNEIAGSMQYVVEGRLVVSRDRGDAADAKSSWRVEALDIDTGRSPPAAPQQQPPPPRGGRGRP